MDGARYRVLLIGRGLYLGAFWGAVFGSVTWILWCLAWAAQGGLAALVFLCFACPVGGVVGAAVGLAASLALALSGPPVIGQLFRARLVTGGVAAAVPLAVALQLHRPLPVEYVEAAGVAAVAVVAAVLLTPRILNGPPPRKGGPSVPPRPVPRAPAPPPEQ